MLVLIGTRVSVMIGNRLTSKVVLTLSSKSPPPQLLHADTVCVPGEAPAGTVSVVPNWPLAGMVNVT